jgi:hypothetical protein
LLIGAFVSLASAVDTTTTFKTGPSTVSLNLGQPCDNITIINPKQDETLTGEKYTTYGANMCGGVIISFMEFDKDPLSGLNVGKDTQSAVLVEAVTNNLIGLGSDVSTINAFPREIDGKPAAIGSGYDPKYRIYTYDARFMPKPRTICDIIVIGNESMIKSLMRTIHVT